MAGCNVVATEHGRYSLSCMHAVSSAGSVWYDRVLRDGGQQRRRAEVVATDERYWSIVQPINRAREQG